MQRRRLRRRRSALRRLCASDSPVPHTKGFLLPTFCRFSALGPPPSRLPGRWGGSWPHPQGSLAFGTSASAKAILAKLSPNSAGWGGTLAGGAHAPRPLLRVPRVWASRGGVGEVSPEARLAPAPRAVGDRVLSVCPRGWKWLPGARLSAVLLSLRMEVSKRRSRKRRAERGANGLKEGRR